MAERSRGIGGIVLSGLATSVGWGIRGDYGHEAGAMIPGALLSLAVCLASGREDLWRRAAVVGMSARGTFLVYASFWFTAGLCSLIVLGWGKRACSKSVSPGHSWRLGPGFWTSIGLAVVCGLLRDAQGPRRAFVRRPVALREPALAYFSWSHASVNCACLIVLPPWPA